MDTENLNNTDEQEEKLNDSELSEQLIQPEQPEQNLQEEPKRRSFFKSFFGRLLIGIVVTGLLFVTVIILPPALQKIAVPISLIGSGHVSENEATEMAESKEILEKSIMKLDQQLNDLIPKDCYMIINSTDNEFILKKGNEIVRKGRCSTGSNTLLESDKKQKKWLFKTPKGQLTVKSKKTDPVWTKPDWAFIEEGMKVPSPNDPSRFDEGVLGDYALVLGDGYMIHGTIWQRYLGLSVTHGCVRLNDADLEVVYKSLNKGSKVFIF
jgi:L,D-transpeptidase ErfK/SrfK